MFDLGAHVKAGEIDFVLKGELMRQYTFFSAVLFVATATLLTAQTKPTTTGSDEDVPQVIRLSSNEFIGLNGICRIVDQDGGAIKVTLASGSTLELANPGDVRAVRAGIARLDEVGQAQLFQPAEGAVINLAQVTNIWWNDKGLTFWGTDGHAWAHPHPEQIGQTWERLRARLKNSERLNFAEVLPRLLVNLRHLQHASVVNGELRLLMSNKSWPLIRREDTDVVRQALARISDQED